MGLLAAQERYPVDRCFFYNSCNPDQLLQLLGDSNPIFRARAAYELSDRPSVAEAGIEDLIALLPDHTRLEWRQPGRAPRPTSPSMEAGATLVAIGRPAVMPLRNALEDDDPKMRGRATTILGEIGDPVAVGALTALVSDADYNVIRAAIDAIGMIANPGSELTLIALLDHGSSLSDPHAVPTDVRERPQDPDPEGADMVERLTGARQLPSTLARPPSRRPPGFPVAFPHVEPSRFGSRAAMRLPRVHLFELEDQPWFPVVIRDLATDYLQFVQDRLALHKPIVPILREALASTKSSRIIDLCSGGGGPVASLQPALSESGLKVSFVLTDRYPNLPAFRALAHERIDYEVEGVDARDVPERLGGFRTLFNAFHHFAPCDAVAVLQNAAASNQPIGIFEIPERTVRALLPFVFLTPLVVLLATPLIRPFRWQRLLLTYMLPLVPLTCWWDGIVSHLRAYHVDELESLGRRVSTTGYRWEAGRVGIPGTPSSVTYLIGTPSI